MTRPAAAPSGTADPLDQPRGRRDCGWDGRDRRRYKLQPHAAARPGHPPALTATSANSGRRAAARGLPDPATRAQSSERTSSPCPVPVNDRNAIPGDPRWRRGRPRRTLLLAKPQAARAGLGVRSVQARHQRPDHRRRLRRRVAARRYDPRPAQGGSESAFPDQAGTRGATAAAGTRRGQARRRGLRRLADHRVTVRRYPDRRDLAVAHLRQARRHRDRHPQNDHRTPVISIYHDAPSSHEPAPLVSKGF
jgi:hypothetical protein